MFRFFAIAIILLLIVSYFKKDRWPKRIEIQEPLFQEPNQSRTDVKPFEVSHGGITYTIKPLFTYELYGMVVSYNDVNDSILPDYYRTQWKDHLNQKDICVIWGSNLMDENYQKLNYSNGSWTCYFGTHDTRAWNEFSPQQLSNNHLLASNPIVGRAIHSAEIGDQIRFKGYLAEYSHSGGFLRKTSTSRTDTGGTACETVFVEEFEIVKPLKNSWREIFRSWPYALLSLLLIWIALTYINTYSRQKPI